MNLKVSIITICYNAEKTIEQTIQSVLGQTYPHVEYVIVDGKSTDGTMEIVNRYRDKITKVISEPDEGIYDAMNKGIRMTSGDVIGIVNADDWIEPDAIEHVVRCFLDHDTDIVHGDIRLVYEDGMSQEAMKTDSLDKLWHSMVVRHPATFVKKDVYEKQGLFDTSYRITGDYDFILRCYANGVRFCYLDKILSNFRMDGISNTGSRECAKETRQVSLTYIDKAPDSSAVYKELSEIMDNEFFLEIFEDHPQKILDLIEEMLPEIHNGVMIRGIGIWGHQYMKLMQKCNVPVRYFIDSDNAKIGTYVGDIPVISPEEAAEKDLPVFVAIKKADDALLQTIKGNHCLHENVKEEVLRRYKKKTIFYFFDYGTSFGGAANTLLQQAVLAKEAGYDVMAFVSGYEGNSFSSEYKKKFEKHKIEFKRLDFVFCSHTEEIDIMGVLDCYENVRKMVLRHRPVLLHSMQINPVVELVSRELKIPHVMNIYQAIPEFFSLPYTDIFPKYHICDSECFAKMWREGLQMESTCIRTVVHDFMARYSVKAKEELRFICVGQVTSRKNQLEVIKGFERALETGIKGKLYLYGYDEEPYAKECAEYVIAKGLENQICFCGFCASMKEAYEQADVLICGSRVESYPNVISEALANGLIIVSTPVAGVPEVICDGENGYLTEGYKAEDIEKKLLQCYEDFCTGKAQKILECANATFEKVHAKEQVTAELVEYYESLIERGIPEGLPGIREIREQFDEIICQYKECEDKFIYPKLMKTKLWYIYHMREVLAEATKKGKKIYIWGTGKVGLHALQVMKMFCSDIPIEGYVDSYKEGDCEGYEIFKPDFVLKNQETVVLPALMNGFEEVVAKLKQTGKIYGQEYFQLIIREW